MRFLKEKFVPFILTICMLAGLLPAAPVYASEAAQEALDEHMALPISSNAIPNWPQGPVVGSESACLLDVDTGTILYDKNMNKAEYPASTTKVMTCLLAAENCQMDEIVTFSKEAVFGIEEGSSNVGMDVGQEITMEQALYCIMLASANEVASAVAEHVAGSIDAFADMMNEKAKELGCTNTHFVNANGLHNDDHYTTAHDLALITAAYFKNEKLAKIANTTYYEMHATDKQPDEFGIANHHKMLPGKDYAYEYIIGGKTGYTNMARQTLTSCAEKDGMKLVAVVMRDEAPHQWTDTKELFEYGFDNFHMVNVAENEDRYTVDNANFFQTTNNLFGETKTLFSIDPSDEILLPSTIDFKDADHDLTYRDDDSDVLADITYSYQGIPLGTGKILIEDQDVNSFTFGQEPTASGNSVSGNGMIVLGAGNTPNAENSDSSGSSGSSDNSNASGSSDQESDGAGKKQNVVFVNYRPLLIYAGIGVAAIFLLILIIAIIRKLSIFPAPRKSRRRRRKYHYHSEFDDFDF